MQAQAFGSVDQTDDRRRSPLQGPRNNKNNKNTKNNKKDNIES